jgi:bacteriocin-like protein
MSDKTSKKETEKKDPKRAESLDSLVQELNKDDLRHVIGGGRSKEPYFR